MSETPLPADPLLRRVALSHEVTVPVLGVPVRFRSNSPDVLDAAHQSFGRWVRGRPVGPAACEYRIVLHPGSEITPVRSPVRVRMPDPDRLVWHTAGSLAILDLGRNDAVAYVTADFLADGEHFRFSMLEGGTLVLVASHDRVPVHGAMITRGNVAVILAGPSGRGKSTVSYAALRRGWRVLADDGVYVQTSPSLRIWGRPAGLLLPDDAPQWFPELAGREPTRQAGGKLKIPVDSRITEEPEPVADAVVCILERGDRVGLEPLRPAEVEAALAVDREPGLAPYGDAPARVGRMLSARGGWRLTLSDDPGDAVGLLEGIAG